MKIHPELRALVAELKELGYVLHQARRSSHIHVRTPEGKFVWSLPLTPSDWRVRRQLRTDLRKVGVPLK